MLLAATTPAIHGTNWLPVIVGLLSATGIAGAVTALLKARPESSKIVVEAAQGAVVVQSGVIDDLRQAQADAQGTIADLRRQVAEQAAQIRQLRADMSDVPALRQQVRGLEEDNHRLRQENIGLRVRVGELERKAPS